jgi:hypothetical protein
MNAIANYCRSLKNISIYGCPNITEAGFINLIENYTGLESIDISSNKWVTDRSMNAIAKNCHGLKNIYIFGCGNTNAGLIAVAAGCPEVRNQVLKQIQSTKIDRKVLNEDGNDGGGDNVVNAEYDDNVHNDDDVDGGDDSVMTMTIAMTIIMMMAIVLILILLEKYLLLTTQWHPSFLHLESMIRV